jgi:hypothetical protein
VGNIGNRLKTNNTILEIQQKLRNDNIVGHVSGIKIGFGDCKDNNTKNTKNTKAKTKLTAGPAKTINISFFALLGIVTLANPPIGYKVISPVAAPKYWAIII